MRRILAWVFVWTIAVLALPVIVAVVVLEVYFAPYRPGIAKLIETADPEERKLPPPVGDLLLCSLHGRTTRGATGDLIVEFDPDAVKSPDAWKRAYPGWGLFVVMHYSEQERLTVIAHLAYTGGGRHGLSKTSQALFERPLSELSLTEAGTLVALVGSPGLYNKPDRLAERRDRLLARCQQHKAGQAPAMGDI
jgi:hypothetical protein